MNLTNDEKLIIESALNNEIHALVKKDKYNPMIDELERLMHKITEEE